jgi:sec-independent protein translocase protein TatC
MSFLGNFLNKRSDNPGAEMNFLDHVEALRWHIIRAVAVVLLAAIFVFVKIEWIFDHIILGPSKEDFISYRVLCQMSKALHIPSLCLGTMNIKFQNPQLSGQFTMSISTSMMLGFILAFPYVVWELWKFIKPALTPSEIRGARGLVFWCSLLFFAGVVFSYYVLAPYTINFFVSYTLNPAFQNIITIENYYDTLSDMILGMGIVFELPVAVYFLSAIGILTPKVMKTRRKFAILILVILAEIITPPDWFSWFFVFIPLLILYEISVVISERAVKERKRKEALKYSN